MKTLALAASVSLIYGFGYLTSVGFCWLVLFILSKLGLIIKLNIWWLGLLTYIIGLMFSKS